MWINPFPVIWRAEPVRLDFHGDVGVQFERVRERLRGWRISDWFREGCRGRVGVDRLRLERYRPWRRRHHSPVLDISPAMDERGPCLVGVYRNAWQVRVFLSIWFAFVIAIIPLLFGAAVTSMWARDRTGAVMLMILPTAMFLFGRVILTVG